jgi:ATP-binding cassette subfamily B protein
LAKKGVFVAVVKKQKVQGLLSRARGQGWLFAGSLICLTVAVGLESGSKLIIRRVVDGVLGGHVVITVLLLWAGLYLGISLTQALFGFLEGRARARSAENIVREIRERLYDHLQMLSYTYHDNNPSGELVQRSTSDVDAVRRFYAELVPGLVRVGLLYVVNFITMTFISLKLALIASLIVPLVAGISSFFFARIHKAYSAHQDQEGNLTAFVQENLAGSRVVRAFARQNMESDRFEGLNREQRKRGFRVVFWHTLYWPIAHFFCGMQYAGAFLYAGWLVITKELTLGGMIASTFIANSMVWPMQELGRMIAEISRSTVSFGRISEILSQDRETHSDRICISSGDLRGEVEFRDLGFSYVEGVPVLENVSFAVRPGEKIALLGTTGSGKTSIVNLIPRFYDFTSGDLLLDGVTLRAYDRYFLRSKIGIVEQDPFLFSVTIHDNIAYGVDRDVTQEEIEAAAKAADIHDTILAFPEGYGTLVGEKGVSLSGGQKQRIAIARALLKDPRVLILDDSTSAVDAETESRIQNALEALMKGRTTFVIAHRIQTLRSADRILVMEQGHIVQAGTHGELAAVPGFYREVFELQTRIEDELAREIKDAI